MPLSIMIPAKGKGAHVSKVIHAATEKEPSAHSVFLILK